MQNFVSIRKTMQYKCELSAKAEKVFPLLCPVREYEWIQDWECDLIYSESGIAEKNCVFTTNYNNLRQHWAVSRYCPEETTIEFILSVENCVFLNYIAEVKNISSNKSEIIWTKIFTGLNKKGNAFLDAQPEEDFVSMMKGLNEKLEYFLVHGKMLPRE